MYRVFIGNNFHQATNSIEQAQGWAKELSRDFAGQVGYVWDTCMNWTSDSFFKGRRF